MPSLHQRIILINNGNPNNQCSIDEQNIFIHGISPNPVIIHPVTLNNDVEFDSFYQCLTTKYDDRLIANENIDSIKPDDQKEINQALTKSFNFASFDSGAMVLEISDGIKSSKSILSNRKDKYMMMACDLQEKWFVIQLSEDIAVDNLQVTNLEHYSSNIKDIRIYARTTSDDNNDTNSQNWFIISDFQLGNKNTNSISFPKNHYVRLLKIEILSYYGNEYYCTLTQIKVFGRTMLPHWKNAVIEHFDEVDQIKQNINNNTNNVSHVNNITLHNKMEQSVFTILTKRISSLELNLTKQQMQVSHLANLFSKIDGLDQRFDEYQINLTNHMLFQTYGISRMLKSLKENNGTDTNQSNKENKTNGMNEHDSDSFRMYSDWSSQKSYYNDVLSWKRHEQLERIETYMESLLLMITNLYWIGLFIIISQVIMAICFIGYVCGCCETRKKSRKHPTSNKRRIAPASNRSSTRNTFGFSRTLSQLNIKRKNNRKRFKK